MATGTPEIIIRDTQAMDFEEVRRGRVHMIRRKRLPLETGIEGITMEYSLSVVPDGYFTPRHRHNFDQIRYTLSGLQSTGLGDLAARSEVSPSSLFQIYPRCIAKSGFLKFVTRPLLQGEADIG